MFKSKQILEYKQSIDTELKKLLEKTEKKKILLDKNLKTIFSYIKDFNLRGGKRVRGILTIIGYTLFKNFNKEIVKAAVAFELLESFALVHDDITDDDELRRGSLTLHRAYEKIYNKKGTSLALVAGDLLGSMGNELLTNLKFNNKEKVKALNIYNNAIVVTCYGQMYDLLLEEKKKITESELSKLHELKTAHYTIAAPLKLGAALAGANEKDLKLIESFAIPLGKAFQLKDDILGMFGNRTKLGKSPLSDLKQAKKTLLTLKALQKANHNQKHFLQRHIGNKNITLSELQKIRKIIIKTGSLDYSLKVISNLVKDSKTIIKQSKFNHKAKELLLQISNYIVMRSY